MVGWEPPTVQERVKLIRDEARHALAVAQVRSLGQERLQVIAYDAMQHARSGTARGVVDRRQGHRARLRRLRAGTRGASVRDVVKTRKVARAVSVYIDDGADRSSPSTERVGGPAIDYSRVVHRPTQRSGRYGRGPPWTW